MLRKVFRSRETIGVGLFIMGVLESLDCTLLTGPRLEVGVDEMVALESLSEVGIVRHLRS